MGAYDEHKLHFDDRLNGSDVTPTEVRGWGPNAAPITLLAPFATRWWLWKVGALAT